jgi:hypothetical protein
MRLSTRGKFALGSTIGLLAFVPTPATVALAGPASANVPCIGQAALVAAVNAANAAGGGTINLASGCHYSLLSADNPGNGLPVVTTRIGVNGNGATIDGTNTVRVFEVDGPGGNLTLNNLTVTGGAADIGGGIENPGGTVTLNHSRVISNTAAVAGGGIASATFDPSSVARLTLNNSEVTGNNQTLSSEESDSALGGGGILNILGTVILNGSGVDTNTAMGFVGGGIANGDYMNFSGGTTSFLTLNNSHVNDNNAPNAGGGGGIQNLLGSVTLNSSEVDRNTAPNGGGISSGNGGFPSGSHLVLNKSEVDGNTASVAPGEGPPIAGGGIANGGEAVLNSSEVDNNTASHVSGAGIVNHGAMILNKSEVNGNTAAGSGPLASGGGIINGQGPPGTGDTILTLNNSQVNDNTAGGNGGGIANGLGSMLPGAPVTLNHSQVTRNTAAHGGGIFNFSDTVTLSASNVTGNHPDNCEPPGTIAGCVG